MEDGSLEKRTQDLVTPTTTSREKPTRARPKTSLRMKYEAEVSVTQRQIGDLESIRQKLGLSQRKMAQLLLVDPSAWHRWTRGDGDAPPHIYRALQWYLALNAQWPESTPSFWLGSVARVNKAVEPSHHDTYRDEFDALKCENEKMRAEVQVLTETLQLEAKREAKIKGALPLWGKIIILTQLLTAGALFYALIRS